MLLCLDANQEKMEVAPSSTINDDLSIFSNQIGTSEEVIQGKFCKILDQVQSIS